jgi:hypothetical protein
MSNWLKEYQLWNMGKGTPLTTGVALPETVRDFLDSSNPGDRCRVDNNIASCHCTDADPIRAASCSETVGAIPKGGTTPIVDRTAREFCQYFSSLCPTFMG